MQHGRVRLRDLGRILWRDRWLVLGVTVLAGALSVAFALTREPLYESEAVLAPARDDSVQLAALSGILGQFSALTGPLGLPSGNSTLDETVAVLQSRDFTTKFIRSHDLLPLLFPERWNPVTRQWRVQAPTDERAYERFSMLRTVIIDRRTNFVRCALRASTPQLAQAWASSLIADLNSEMRARAVAESRRSIALLSERIESVKYESIRNAAASLLEAQLNREVLAQSREDYALRIVDSPSRPEQRSYPRRRRMTVLGTGLGFLLAAFISICRRAWIARRSAAPSQPV